MLTIVTAPKKQIHEVTKVALLTNMKESSAIRSYRRLLHVGGAWVGQMELPHGWALTAKHSFLE